VNDIHSKLNRTIVANIVPARSVECVQAAVSSAQIRGGKICVAGGRHAMGAQQFASDATLVDMTGFNRVLNLDRQRGLVQVEAGIKWPDLINHLVEAQLGGARQWGIRQKQTGADGLTIGGALAANIHGRGLQLKPIIDDVESFVLIDQGGNAIHCSRSDNSELFKLAIGGYGLFGIVSHVTLRLAPRRMVRRDVRVIGTTELMPAVSTAIESGALFGDFQFAIDNQSDDFLRQGILSTYHPARAGTALPARQKTLSPADWRRLVYLAHYNKSAAFQEYKRHYLATQGQIYWSDTHQLSTYLDDYHGLIDKDSPDKGGASEIITEIYVPRASLATFLECVREDFRYNSVDLIYGTIRLIERDNESFLAWAREPYACVIFNIHTAHTREGIDASAATFRRLIDMAIRFGGNYYLTYHKFGTAEQLLACYPQFPAFLELKRRYDPNTLFDSDWHRHYRRLLAK
jgi:FAD/FMN-containing dehydrogenase